MKQKRGRGLQQDLEPEDLQQSSHMPAPFFAAKESECARHLPTHRADAHLLLNLRNLLPLLGGGSDLSTQDDVTDLALGQCLRGEYQREKQHECSCW